ncbi:MAG: DapH/DapD/GlmU-related protein [Ferrovibrio sp.]
MVGLDKDLLDALGDRVVAIFDLKHAGTVWGIPVIGGDEAWAGYHRDHPLVRPLLAIDPPLIRRKLAAHYGLELVAGFVAGTARISARARLTETTVVQHNVYVSADVRIGEGVRIHIGAQLHHDCTIGAFTTIAPRAALMGGVVIGENVYIGAGAVIKQGIAVGDGAVIGAGAVVIRPVGRGETVAGVPARPIAKRKA